MPIAAPASAIEAARCVLAQRGIAASEIECIIVCTVTPDMMFPSTACLVQDRIGAAGAVTVTRFLAHDTIEERIDEVLRRKRDLSDTILSQAEAPAASGTTARPRRISRSRSP